MTIAVGERAPDFTLGGASGVGEAVVRREFSLGDYRGRPVILVFYPADSSPVCTEQLTTYSHDIAQFEVLGVQVLAISPQGVDEHERFAAANGGFGFPLLSDIGQTVGGAYGVLGPMGFYRRSVFVVDAEGIVRYAHRSTAGLTFRPTAELLGAVQAIAA